MEDGASNLNARGSGDGIGENGTGRNETKFILYFTVPLRFMQVRLPFLSAKHLSHLSRPFSLSKLVQFLPAFYYQSRTTLPRCTQDHAHSRTVRTLVSRAMAACAILRRQSM